MLTTNVVLNTKVNSALLIIAMLYVSGFIQSIMLVSYDLKDKIVYSNKFSNKGFFAIEKIEFVLNNPVSKKEIVSVIHAKHIKTGLRVSATSTKFSFEPENMAICCVKCGDYHNLEIHDAGSGRELARLCVSCFGNR